MRRGVRSLPAATLLAAAAWAGTRAQEPAADPAEALERLDRALPGAGVAARDLAIPAPDGSVVAIALRVRVSPSGGIEVLGEGGTLPDGARVDGALTFDGAPVLPWARAEVQGGAFRMEWAWGDRAVPSGLYAVRVVFSPWKQLRRVQAQWPGDPAREEAAQAVFTIGTAARARAERAAYAQFGRAMLDAIDRLALQGAATLQEEARRMSEVDLSPTFAAAPEGVPPVPVGVPEPPFHALRDDCARAPESARKRFSESWTAWCDEHARRAREGIEAPWDAMRARWFADPNPAVTATLPQAVHLLHRFHGQLVQRQSFACEPPPEGPPEDPGAEAPLGGAGGGPSLTGIGGSSGRPAQPGSTPAGGAPPGTIPPPEPIAPIQSERIRTRARIEEALAAGAPAALAAALADILREAPELARSAAALATAADPAAAAADLGARVLAWDERAGRAGTLLLDGYDPPAHEAMQAARTALRRACAKAAAAAPGAVPLPALAEDFAAAGDAAPGDLLDEAAGALARLEATLSGG